MHQADGEKTHLITLVKLRNMDHIKDIHSIIYLEQIIYAADGMISEKDVVNTDLGTGTPPSISDSLRLLAHYDQNNGDPHHRHWHRTEFAEGVVYLSKPASFEPF